MVCGSLLTLMQALLLHSTYVHISLKISMPTLGVATVQLGLLLELIIHLHAHSKYMHAEKILSDCCGYLHFL